MCAELGESHIHRSMNSPVKARLGGTKAPVSPHKVAVTEVDSDDDDSSAGGFVADILSPEEKLRELEDWESTLSGRVCRYSLYFFQIALSPLLFPFVFGYVYAFNEDVNEDDDSHSAGVDVSLAQLSFIRRQKTIDSESKSSFGSLNFMKNNKINGIMSKMRFKNVAKAVIGKKDQETKDDKTSAPLRPDKPVPPPTAKLSFATAAIAGKQVKEIVKDEYTKNPNALNALALANISGEAKKGGLSLQQLANKTRMAENNDNSDDNDGGSDGDGDGVVGELVRDKPTGPVPADLGTTSSAVMAGKQVQNTQPVVTDLPSSRGPRNPRANIPETQKKDDTTSIPRRDSGAGAKDPGVGTTPPPKKGLPGSGEGVNTPEGLQRFLSRNNVRGPSVKVIMSHRTSATALSPNR